MRNLVYYSVGGQNVYATMLMYSIKSLDRSNPNGYDVVITTSKQYADFNFSEYKRPNTYFNYVEAVKDGWFCTYDGNGYWVKNGLRSDDEVSKGVGVRVRPLVQSMGIIN